MYEEKTIISCLLKGQTIKQIANLLGIAKSTVSYKTKKIFDKYGILDRHELANKIYKNNLTKLKEEIIRLQVENENLRSAVR